MITTTLYLAAAGGSAPDPWHVLGQTYDTRLAIAALADLALARRVVAGPERDDESAFARELRLVAGTGSDPVLTAAEESLMSARQPLDVDRALRALRDLTPVVERSLVDSGSLVEAGQKGLLKKRTVLAPAPGAVEAAQGRIRDAAGAAADDAAARALVLVATTGLSMKRMERLCGTGLTAPYDPFDPFEPSFVGADGAPLGDGAAGALTALVVTLAGTADHTDDFDVR